MARTAYSVYVIELSKRVFTENAKFRAANPQFNGVLQCLYVGMTSCTPEARFQQHLAGYKAARFVKKHGLWLRKRLYQRLNPMTKEKAGRTEGELASRLRNRGYAVWWN